MAHKIPYWLTIVFMLTYLVASSSGSETDILIKFKNSLSNECALSNWNPSVSPCNGNTSNWSGLRCSNWFVYGLTIENMGLTGLIDIITLQELTGLRTLSFMNNSFDGPMPDIKKLGALRMLYLSHNRFSGEIPDDAFVGLNSLKKVYLARNQFTGKIPKSLAELPELLELSLEGNQFDGKIPDFQGSPVTMVNLANNHLEGSIPARLSTMNSSFFTGNNDLCGKPLAPCKSNKKRSYQLF